MKTTIASILINNAIEFVKGAHNSHNNNQPDDELRNSIGAHLMIALALEGIGNEIGELIFTKKVWKSKDKIGTVTKWHLISGISGKPFDPNEEPLITIKHVNSIRNKIVHPKRRDLGIEMIIRSPKGELIRNPSPDYILKEGDHIFAGIERLLNEFNYETSLEIVNKSILCIKKLCNHLSITGLEWIDDFEKILIRIK